MQLPFLLKYSKPLFKCLKIFDNLLLQCHVLHGFLIDSTSILLTRPIKPRWLFRWIDQRRALLSDHYIVALVIWSIKRWWTWCRPIVFLLFGRIIYRPFSRWLLKWLFFLTWSLLGGGDTINRSIFISLVRELPPWGSNNRFWFWFIQVMVWCG